jgi:ubiquinone/menaquinone biosynthesis C-methylase UbiE
MAIAHNPIVDTYSRLADKYDEELNLRSCWGQAATRAQAHLHLKDSYRTVVDVGCGTGRALLSSARKASSAQLFGIDPADNMRKLAIHRTASCANVQILDGCFEQLPLESVSVDYLYSIFAFHWTTDLEASVQELLRVLRHDGEMDLFFIGRNNGREFIIKTTPIFFKYMGAARLLASAKMRKQLTKEAATTLFGKPFSSARLLVEESYDTYYDTLDGHWGWWVRIEGHFMDVPPAKKQACYDDVRQALASLAMEDGKIPYTIHQLHVRVHCP